MSSFRKNRPGGNNPLISKAFSPARRLPRAVKRRVFRRLCYQLLGLCDRNSSPRTSPRRREAYGEREEGTRPFFSRASGNWETRSLSPISPGRRTRRRDTVPLAPTVPHENPETSRQSPVLCFSPVSPLFLPHYRISGGLRYLRANLAGSISSTLPTVTPYRKPSGYSTSGGVSRDLTIQDSVLDDLTYSAARRDINQQS
jgi:hypothetical protein